MTNRQHELRALKCRLENLRILADEAEDFALELELEDVAFYLGSFKDNIDYNAIDEIDREIEEGTNNDN